MTEADFIAALRALPLHAGARGLEDDCAVLELGGESLILTHDMMVEGTHFRDSKDGGVDMADVAWKLVASNLSDLAAKGAEPLGVLLGHSLGQDDARFINGLREALEAFDTVLLGGDTVSAPTATPSPSRTFGLTAIGKATCTPIPSRNSAQIGDFLYVTGTLGRAMLGFEGEQEHLTAFNRPIPRLSQGRKLAPLVNAMMDVSDGLLLDTFRMAEASNTSISLNSKDIPVALRGRLNDCLTWGDDYELLFTLPPETPSPIKASHIGTIEPRGFAPLILDGEPILNAQGLGYQHG